MLAQVDARTPTGVTLELPLTDILNGYAVEDIDGLDPVPANVVSTSYVHMDGEQYQSSRREKRNIILKIGLEPDYVTQSVAQLRNALYVYFMPKKKVHLTFRDDTGLVTDIDGVVESFDCPLFVQEPIATISVICHLPDFVDLDTRRFNGNTVSTAEMSNLVYDGTVDTGITFTMTANRSMTGFSIIQQPFGETEQKLDFVMDLLAGDIVVISTVPGNKFARLTRSGTEMSVLYGISPYSAWTTLQPGSNSIRVYATGAAVPYMIEYTDKYGGL